MLPQYLFFIRGCDIVHIRHKQLCNKYYPTLSTCLLMSDFRIIFAVFSRWESVTPSIRLFADYWIVIYFFARTIAQMEKSGSYLKTLSCALLSLMYNSSMPSNDGDLLHLSNSMRAMTRYYQRIHCRRILRQYFWSSHISWTASIHGIIMVRSPSSTSVLCRLLYDMHAYHHR